jgi:3-carboxy-cis,cis-muconate cycloisomerase
MLAAMSVEHQRAAGGWQAEAQTLSELLGLTGSAVAAVRSLLEDLEVRPERMRANLEQTGGLVMGEALTTALTESLGREQAHELVEQASRDALARGASFREIVAGVPEIAAALGEGGIDAALEPTAYLGSSAELIYRALAAHRALVDQRMLMDRSAGADQRASAQEG